MATSAITVWNSLYTAIVAAIEGTDVGKFRKIHDGYFDPLSSVLPALGMEVIQVDRGMQIGDEFRKIITMKIRIAYEITASRPNQTALTQMSYVEDFLDTLAITDGFKFRQEQKWSISNPADTEAPSQVGTCEALFTCEANVTFGDN